MLAGSDYLDTIEPSSPTMDRGIDFFQTQDQNESTMKLNSSPLNNSVAENSVSKTLQIHSMGKTRKNHCQEMQNVDSKFKSRSCDSRKTGDSLDYVDDYYSKDNAQTEGKLGSEKGSGSDLTNQQVVLTTDSDMLTGVTAYQAVQVSKLFVIYEPAMK